MKIHNKYNLEKFDCGIHDYSKDILLAISNYVGHEGTISDGLEIKNFIDLTKYVFFMNVREIKGNTINNHYAFFYLSLNDEDVEKFSNLVLVANNFQTDDQSVKISAMTESCNRIGAKLLKYIKKEGSSFDIGTPILYMHLPPEKEVPEDKKYHIWPVIFQCIKIDIAGIPMEFACTILESPKQRIDKILPHLIDAENRNKLECEKEFTIKDMPKFFNTHFVAKLHSQDKVIISLSSKYINDAKYVIGAVSNSIEEVKRIYTDKLLKTLLIEEVSVRQDELPDEIHKYPAYLMKINLKNSSSRFTITFVPHTQSL